MSEQPAGPHPSPAPSTRGRLRHRKNVTGLLPRQAAAVRAGFAAVSGITDERGFAYHAGIHGLPLPVSCFHGSRLFLPWHRAYLYLFELALQDQVPAASLPWWDWSSAQSHTLGIPALYRRETLADGSANPLHHQPIPAGIAGGQEQPTRTSRDPQDPSQLPTRADVQDVLAAGDFRDFNNRLENLHNWVHVWVGGTMGDIAYAAYDPLFWAHHAMVDRIWRLWQLAHTGIGSIDRDLLDAALPPFPMTVRMTLDVASLGYEYAVSTASATVATSEEPS